MAKPNTSSSHSHEATIAEGTRIRGRVVGEGDIALLGSLEGDVALKGALLVGSSGQAISNVDVDSLTIEGELVGDVAARQRVHVVRGGKLRGNVTSDRFNLEEGAEFAGQLSAEFELPAELGREPQSPRRR